MKKALFSLLFLISFLSLQAQYSIKGFGFQAYAVDAEGKALASVAVTVKFTLSPVSGTGLTYSETRNETTDAYGVFTSIVGGASPASSSNGPFSVLNFDAVDYKLQVEVKKTSGGTYTEISNEPLKAVPYARAAANGVPVGTIVAFGGDATKVPAGWALCDGKSVDGASAEWKQLYSMVGTSWGGSGTTFNLPDLRGRFIRGVDENAGNDPDKAARVESASGGNVGNKVGTLQGDTIQVHNHSVTDPGHNHSNGDFQLLLQYDKDQTGNSSVATTDYSADEPDLLNSGGIVSSKTGVTVDNTGGNETRPVNAAVNYIIKK